MANNLLWGGNAGIVRGVFGEVIIQGKRFSNRWLGPSPGGSAKRHQQFDGFHEFKFKYLLKIQKNEVI